MIYLRSHVDTPFRDVILDACSHNLVFEPFSNGTQSHHLFTVLHHAIRTQSDRDFYQHSTFDNLEKLDDDADRYNADHLFDLVRFWQTREGKRLIYRKFNAQPAMGNFAGARALIFVDGFDGFKYAAERLGEEILAHGSEFVVGRNSFRLDDHLFYTLKWCIGEEEAASGLEQVRQNANIYMAAYFAAVDEARDSRRKRPLPDVEKLGYEDIQKLIDKDDSSHVTLSSWGKYASSDALKQAAHDLVHETDLGRLVKRLALFRRVSFPFDPDYLVTLVWHENEDIRIAAIEALEQMTHPSLRPLALKMIEQDQILGRSIGLLKNDFHEDDWRLIESLTSRSLDDYDYHVRGINTLELFEKYPSHAATMSLLNCYEHGPCAFCRESFIKGLSQLQAIPEWMVEECHYDSNDDVREGAKIGFQNWAVSADTTL